MDCNLEKEGNIFPYWSSFLFNPIRRWVNYSPGSAAGNLKVITYNIHGGQDLPALKSFLEGEAPDVIFFRKRLSQ